MKISKARAARMRRILAILEATLKELNEMWEKEKAGG